MSARFSLHGVLNPSQLDDIFSFLYSQLESQAARIDSLEQMVLHLSALGHVQATATAHSVDQWQLQSQEDRDTGFDTRLLNAQRQKDIYGGRRVDAAFVNEVQQLQRVAESLEKKKMERMQELIGKTDELAVQLNSFKEKEKSWDACVQNFSSCVGAEQVSAMDKKLELRFLEIKNELLSLKADTAPCKELQHGYNCILESISNLETAMHGKVNKAEMPLLKIASDTIARSNEYVQELSGKIKNFEELVQRVQTQLTVKEDKDTMVARMQKIAEQLNNKVDAKQFNESETAQKNVADSLQSTLAAVTQRLDSEPFSNLNIQLGSLRSTLETIATKLGQKADRELFVSTKQQDQTIALLSKEISSEFNALHGLVASLNSQLTTMQNAFVTLEARTNICIKFVDWYAETGDRQKMAFK